MKTLSKNNSGFTFIEVMIATVIFVLAALAASDLARGSVRAVKDAQDVTQATWLLQKVIAELETKIESEGIQKACEEKKTGTFEAPYNKFSWTTFCSEIDFKISEAASSILGENSAEVEEKNQENLAQKMLLNLASKYISDASRELHAEVIWLQGNLPRKVDVTTHVARYDMPLPNLGGS